MPSSASHYPGPALNFQSDSYPKGWKGRVPKRVRMTMTVFSEIPFEPNPLSAVCGREYDTRVNIHGAVAVYIGDERLGVKPDEFEIVEWHEVQR